MPRGASATSTSFLARSFGRPSPITTSRSSGGARSKDSFGNELAELLQIDVAARDDGDYRPLTRLAGEPSRQAERTSSLGDDARLLRHESHGALPRPGS